MRINKKIAAGIAAGAIVLGGGGVAFAYWTSGGTGAGSASTSAGAANLTLAQTSTLANLYPGGAPQAITGTVTNNADNSAYVTSVTVSIASVTPAAGATGSCDTSDYTLGGTTIMAVGKDVASKASATFSGATIAFNNKPANQDACKGATVNLT